VFGDLNKGADVTKGLKKVDPSQMTHKNPSLRTSAPVPERSDSNGSLRSKSPAPPKAKKPESMRTKKPPRKELDGNKWIIVS
jgi:adenylyl cyclase-associated protein